MRPTGFEERLSQQRSDQTELRPVQLEDENAVEILQTRYHCGHAKQQRLIRPVRMMRQVPSRNRTSPRLAFLWIPLRRLRCYTSE